MCEHLTHDITTYHQFVIAWNTLANDNKNDYIDNDNNNEIEYANYSPKQWSCHPIAKVTTIKLPVSGQTI